MYAPDIVASGKNRSYAELFYDRVNIGKKPRPQSVVHELGHLLENNHELKKKSVGFLKQRIGPGKNPKLMGMRELTGSDFYSNDEYAYINTGFTNPYTAKVYPNTATHVGFEHIDATEIISMGLEQMYWDPVKFMTDDPEFFDFIWDNVIRKTPNIKVGETSYV